MSLREPIPQDHVLWSPRGHLHLLALRSGQTVPKKPLHTKNLSDGMDSVPRQVVGEDLRKDPFDPTFGTMVIKELGP